MLEQQDLARHFGRNLARLRKAAGLSQETLGSLAGLHRTEIGMLERGIRLPRIDTVIKLAGALEIHPGELLDGVDWRPAAPSVGRFRLGGKDAEPRPRAVPAGESSESPRPSSSRNRPLQSNRDRQAESP